MSDSESDSETDAASESINSQPANDELGNGGIPHPMDDEVDAEPQSVDQDGPPGVTAGQTTGTNIVCNPKPVFLDIRYDRNKGKWVSHKSKEFSHAEETKPSDSHVFVWKRTWRRRGHKRTAEVVINCPQLKAVLAAELKSYPQYDGHRNLESNRMKFTNPFYPLIHNWKHLKATAERLASDNHPCSTHLRTLLATIETCECQREYFAARPQYQRDKVVSFDNLGKLFRPGEIVFAAPFNEPQAFIVCDYLPTERENVFRLICWTYKFDGRTFSRRLFAVNFKRYDGLRKVTSLRCYPLKFHESRGGKSMRDILRELGLRYWQLCTRENSHMMFNYDGDVLVKKDEVGNLAARYGEMLASTILMAGYADYRDSRARRPEIRDDIDDAQRLVERSMFLPYSGRVMVDILSYRQFSPDSLGEDDSVPEVDDFECQCLECQENEALKKRLGTNFDGFGRDCEGKWRPFMDEVQAIICPPFVQAYALYKKRWVLVNVNRVCDIPEGELQNRTSLDKVIVPPGFEWRGGNGWTGVKDLLLKLVKNHGIKASQHPHALGTPGPLQDIVGGKGQGLIILLHGASGVGKTLLAEAVAEASGRPLMKISVADIGLDVTTVEQKLDEYFQLATRWKAILLLDESDVLLAQRGKDLASYESNSVVSVFLKVLEYYEGILILTTNRILSFDTAIQSRVHLALDFPQMEPADQKAVFHMFLKDLDPSQMDGRAIEAWLDQNFDAYPTWAFDGRQIRNMLSAAINIARAEERPLALGDIMEIWNRTGRFREELREYTADQNAVSLAPSRHYRNRAIR